MYSRTKTPHPPTRMQIWIDRLRFVLGVVAIIAIAVTFITGQNENNDINNRITKVESPCLRYGSQSRQCHESFQAAIDSITDYQLCTLLAKRPELTNVSAADCRKIAREQHRRGTDVIGQSGVGSERGSPDSQSPGRGQSTPPGVRSAPQEHGGSDSPGSGRHPGNGASPQNPSSQAPPGSQTAPDQDDPSSPGSPGGQSGASEAPPSTSAPESPSSKPPSVVEVEAPGLPVQACVPGVLSVNCPR